MVVSTRQLKCTYWVALQKKIKIDLIQNDDKWLGLSKSSREFSKIYHDQYLDSRSHLSNIES